MSLILEGWEMLMLVYVCILNRFTLCRHVPFLVRKAEQNSLGKDASSCASFTKQFVAEMMVQLKGEVNWQCWKLAKALGNSAESLIQGSSKDNSKEKKEEKKEARFWMQIHFLFQCKSQYLMIYCTSHFIHLQNAAISGMEYCNCLTVIV